MKQSLRVILIFGLILLSFAGCRSYYQINQDFQRLVYLEKYAEAEAVLAKSRKAKKERNKVLYLLERGYVLFMQGKHDASSKYFMEADLMMEDYRKRFGYEALSFILNPGVKPYKAEDFEEVLVHYYNAINFVKLNRTESALIELRRMNLVITAFADKYSKKPKYKEDAFAHLFMGLIYESTGDMNNAFIAYRNAYNVYERDYVPFFETAIPEQLKRDLVRSAAATGFKNEVSFYCKEFGWDEKEFANLKRQPELVLFWNNGFGPIKEKWSIDFTTLQNNDGSVSFVNNQLGFVFNFPAASLSDGDKQNLSSLRLFRISFPRYVQRPVFFTKAISSIGGKSYSFEMAENINAIAFKSLNDRFLREMSNALLRFAIKKGAEIALRKENSNAGAVLGLANAISEQADTRHWQTLPHSILYTRIPLELGANNLTFRAESPFGGVFTKEIQVSAGANRLYFEMVNTFRRSTP